MPWPDPGPGPGLFVPDWPVPVGVQARFSARTGGISGPPWDSLNLGDHVGDDPACVVANRQAWADRLGVRPVYLQQVHGQAVVALDHRTPDGQVADACYTDQRGVACTILVADCLPVLLCDTSNGRVGAAHAGWRGLAGLGDPAGRGVLEALVQHFDPRHTLAWLGPCIGPQAFEVGGEVKAAFEVNDPASAACFVPRHSVVAKWQADLPALARRRLEALGVTRIYGNDSSGPWCTVLQASRFFSHRRDRISGRMAASVWRL